MNKSFQQAPGLIATALDSGLSGPGSSPARRNTELFASTMPFTLLVSLSLRCQQSPIAPGCLLFSRVGRLVHSLGKWQANTANGCHKKDLACSIYQNLLRRSATGLSSLKLVIEAKW